MSPRLPAVTPKHLISILQRRGFVRVHQSGSHAIFRHPDGRRTTVAVHADRDLGRGPLRQIIRDADLTVEDLS